ncbi:HAD family phosphatase [Streptomyces albus]|uniref:HAD family hydrolase n=1 Tax=Streptomyces albus TaxID=1888 RepID=UPI00056C9D6B|nr:HAD family phosphatase [Streptomyces albus]QID38213.1 HAD family phosphatase [Streptomyces albus]
MPDSRCVILDIGGVLEITPATGWVARWEQRLGLAAGAVEWRLGEVWRAGAVGAVGEREVREQVAGRLGLDAARVEAFMADLWAEYLGTPNDELIAYVRGLRPRCRLGILSNSFVGARERETAAYGFDALVEEIVYSHEIGVCKPDPRAFEVVCARLGVRPRDCLFVDDVVVNVEAAQEAGMQAHLFEGNAGTIARIAAHLDGTAPATG